MENAQQNNGRLAERFEHPDTNALQYIVLYSGFLQDIETPTNVFVLQQVTPVRLSNGNWVKSYGRADGSIVLHEEADGNFQRWENENGIRKIVTTAFPRRTP